MRSSHVVLATAGLASAHFQLEYPTWRADTLSNDSYSQYEYPCGGVPADLAGLNRTDWPIAGGSLELDLHHPWSYLFLNLGLGDNVTNFNYSLTPQLWNVTGAGILCLAHLDLPSELAPVDGQHATLQVITLDDAGTSLYNCADLTFRAASVADFGGQNCTTDAGVSLAVVGSSNASSSSSNATSTASGSASSSSASATSAAGARPLPRLGLASLASAVAITCALAWGVGW